MINMVVTTNLNSNTKSNGKITEMGGGGGTPL